MQAKISRLFEIRSAEIEQDDKEFISRFLGRYAQNFKIDWSRDVKIEISKKTLDETDMLVIKVKDVDVESVDMGQGELFDKEKEEPAIEVIYGDKKSEEAMKLMEKATEVMEEAAK